MEKCKDCGAPVVDGEEYCESCLLLRDLGLNEGNDQGTDSFFSEIESLLPSEGGGAGVQENNISEDLNIDDDFLSLVNGSQEENQSDLNREDIFALDESSSEEEETIVTKHSDVGDILSDALGVLNDPAMDEMEKQVFDMIPEKEQKKESREKNGKTRKSKKDKKEKKIQKKDSGEGKEGLFKKLFYNVPGPEPDPDAPTEEEIEAEKKAKAEAKKKVKEEKKAVKKAAKEEKKKQKTAIKAEKKKRIREEEAAEAVKDASRINKVGAALVFTAAAALAAFVIGGTNTFTYKSGVNNAKEYFSNRQYEKAYDTIAGVQVKTKDETIYNKIVTVMYVVKQYNSYENFYNMEMYPEALNSLIKGLKRYDKYSEQAQKLGITNDMNYAKEDIVNALDDSFHLSESDVQYLRDMDTEEYNKEITKLSKEN